MALSKPESIKIVEEDEDGQQLYQLYIDGGRRARLLVNKKGEVFLDIMIAGDFPWQEAGVFILGLNKLAEVGNRLGGDPTDVERFLHKPSEEEIMVKKKAAAAKAAKVAKKSGKKGDAAPRESAAGMFCELIMAGNLTDDKIFEKVRVKFGLDDKKRSYVAWYRNKLKKDGKKPPEAKE